ncbi:MAG: hypothetical protein VB084_08620 [Syntrophomonadaceae bacterium]|nr:hypothetical protein [Syntrophomonadaceae bacterium]
MYWLTVLLLILVIALALIPTCLLTGISIKELAVKRYWIVLFVLMMLATPFSRVIEAKTGSFATGLISGPVILLLGFLPVIYVDYLRRSKSIGYRGARKKIGDWLDQPIKTLFLTKE